MTKDNDTAAEHRARASVNGTSSGRPCPVGAALGLCPIQPDWTRPADDTRPRRGASPSPLEVRTAAQAAAGIWVRLAVFLILVIAPIGTALAHDPSIRTVGRARPGTIPSNGQYSLERTSIPDPRCVRWNLVAWPVMPSETAAEDALPLVLSSRVVLTDTEFLHPRSGWRIERDRFRIRVRTGRQAPTPGVAPPPLRAEKRSLQVQDPTIGSSDPKCVSSMNISHRPVAARCRDRSCGGSDNACATRRGVRQTRWQYPPTVNWR